MTQTADADIQGTAIPLRPHRYPFWIWLIGIGLVAALLASVIHLPPYYHAATLLKEAEALSEQGRDSKAIEFYKRTLAITPTAKRAKIGIAVAYFKSTDVEDHKKALLALQGITLRKGDWSRLTAVMPTEYQQFFTKKQQP